MMRILFVCQGNICRRLVVHRRFRGDLQRRARRIHQQIADGKPDYKDTTKTDAGKRKNEKPMSQKMFKVI
jgi:hypothetical protein